MTYQSAKIYKLVSSSTDKIYIGSTINTLGKRLYQHKHKSNTSSSRLLGQNIDIVLIENYPCNCRNELELRERYWIQNTKNAINKRLPTRTFKEWYNDNIEIQREKNREYRNINKDDINRKKRESRNQETRDYEKKQREKRKDYRKEYDRKRRMLKGEELNKSNRAYFHYKNSWGGDKRYNNNLLTISLDIFN